MNEYNNNENVIESLHRARMEQWIGDFEEAEKIYDTILNYEDKMVIYLKPSIENKKKKLMLDKKHFMEEKKFIEEKDFLEGDEGLSYEQLKLFDFALPSENIRFGSLHKSQPLIKDQKVMINNPVESIWKYSVIADSKVNHIIRFEIRGYSQTKQKPDLRNVSKQTGKLGIKHFVFTPLEQQSPDSVCLDIELGEEKLPYYMEIDSWGCISGEAIVPEDEVNAFFAEQNELFSLLEKALWNE